jgi:hypothetical protein
MMANAVEKVIKEIRSKVSVEETDDFWRDKPGAKRLSLIICSRSTEEESDVVAA